MNYGYDLKNNVLYIDRNSIPAYNIEKNEIGVCSACAANLLSISYHSFDDLVIVAKCSSCNLISANIYNVDWIWLDEIVISHFLSENIQNENVGCGLQEDRRSDVCANFKLLKNIPMKQLQTIFSPAEINAMFSRAKGDECVRQYLYNARKKYDTFENVFGITINV
ncbi:MAG TPA: hypothetical protein C5S50_09675 [Methanosarcinaceae archaeon]|nr:hypothetical protein [Methanosarcinaceae archaeon]